MAFYQQTNAIISYLFSCIYSTAMSFNTFSLMDSPVYNNSGFNTPTPSLRTTHLVESVSKTPSHPFMLYNPSTPVPPLNRSSKRRKENEPLVDLLPLNRAYVQVQVEPPSKKRKTTRDKLDAIFLALQKERLSFGEFIFLASRHKDKNNQPIQRSQTHAMSSKCIWININVCYVSRIH